MTFCWLGDAGTGDRAEIAPTLAFAAGKGMRAPTFPLSADRERVWRRRRTPITETYVAKVIASSIRKGNVLDLDGKLAVVIHAENIHPGKGTPVTHLEMRRIADGVKVTERYRTTDQVERAYLDDKDYNYLFEDDHGYTFMHPETFDQITVSKDVMGDQAQWLQEGMSCTLSLHEGVPIAIEMPARVTLEIVEADPGRQRADGFLVLQAGEAGERRPHHGAAAHRHRHPRRHHDGRRLLRRARQGLTRSSASVVFRLHHHAPGAHLQHALGRILHHAVRGNRLSHGAAFEEGVGDGAVGVAQADPLALRVDDIVLRLPLDRGEQPLILGVE